MKKLIRKIVASVAAFAVALGILLPVTAGAGGISSAPISVAAETQPTEEIIQTGLKSVEDTENAKPGNITGDEYYQFVNGAGISLDASEKQNVYGMYFQLKQVNDFYDGRLNALDEKSEMSFTLYRVNGANSSSPVCEVLIFNTRRITSAFDWEVRTYTEVFFKYYENPSYDAEDFVYAMYPEPLQAEEREFDDAYADAKWHVMDNGSMVTGYNDCKELYAGVRTIDEHANAFHFNREGDVPYLNVYFPVSGTLSSYFVKMEYKISVYDSNADRTGSITSASRSIHDTINRIDEAGALEKEFNEAENLALARKILDEGNRDDITVEYLEELDCGFLAIEKQATVNVPIIDGKVELGDVCAAMNWSSHKCLEANVASIKKNDITGIYEFEYNHAAVLRVATEDADKNLTHTYDSFLSINYDYAEYRDLVKKAFNEDERAEGLYSYFWNVLADKADLTGTRAELEGKIHGYFGQIWLPNRSTLSSINTLLAEAFDTDTATAGLVAAYHTALPISSTDHSNLMKEFDYNWVSTLWDKTLDFVEGEQTTAQYYFFALKPSEENEICVISKTGNANPENPSGEWGDKIGDILGGLFEGWNDTGTLIKSLSSLVVVAACAVGVVWGIGRLKGDKKRKK